MNISTILDLLSDYNLTADELLLVYLTFMARDEEGHPEYFKRWFESGGSSKLRSLFNSLKEKGIILKSYNPASYIPNEIEFNQHFLKSWTKHSKILGKELFDAYPPFMNINGKYAPLKDISKRFASLDDFYFFYSSQIGHNPAKHKEVMDILNWAKLNNHLNFGILNFVISNQWEMLKELRENPDLIPISSESIYLND